ncbi:MAG: glycerol-3-phosphate dehydrogenase, partial [Bacteroidota bacterium]
MAVFNTLTVLGGGSWATALVKIIAENRDIQIRWYLRNKEDAAHINQYGHNPKYLSAVQIRTDRVHASSDAAACLKDAGLVLLAVPSA